jgi:hypothetical protein
MPPPPATSSSQNKMPKFTTSHRLRWMLLLIIGCYVIYTMIICNLCMYIVRTLSSALITSFSISLYNIAYAKRLSCQVVPNSGVWVTLGFFEDIFIPETYLQSPHRSHLNFVYN